VWSRNLVDEEAIARTGLHCRRGEKTKKLKTLLIFKATGFQLYGSIARDFTCSGSTGFTSISRPDNFLPKTKLQMVIKYKKNFGEVLTSVVFP
jgi:hypothetical protein